MFGYNVSLLNVGKAISETLQKKAYSLCSFDPAEYSRLMNEIETKELKKNDIQKELHLVADQIKQEKSKIDEYSVDIDLTAQWSAFYNNGADRAISLSAPLLFRKERIHEYPQARRL